MPVAQHPHTRQAAHHTGRTAARAHTQAATSTRLACRPREQVVAQSLDRNNAAAHAPIGVSAQAADASALTCAGVRPGEARPIPSERPQPTSHANTPPLQAGVRTWQCTHVNSQSTSAAAHSTRPSRAGAAAACPVPSDRPQPANSAAPPSIN